MAVLDIALDIGALGREGKSVGTSFVIGDSVSIVVSESTGRVTIFEKGRIIASLEPVISRRIE